LAVEEGDQTMGQIRNTRIVQTVPAREGRAFVVEKGELIKVIDVRGQQAVDFFAFCRDDPREYLSAEHTRVGNLRLFPGVGQAFYTNRRRPILTFVDDASPGTHDMLVAACDPTRYASLGVKGWHASCQENLISSMRVLGVEGIEVPSPVNLFANFPLGPDGSLNMVPPRTKPGDCVVFKAELPIYVCVSACPQDLNETNAGNPTEAGIEIGR
jgi:uncharacterized protein